MEKQDTMKSSRWLLKQPVAKMILRKNLLTKLQGNYKKWLMTFGEIVCKTNNKVKSKKFTCARSLKSLYCLLYGA